MIKGWQKYSWKSSSHWFHSNPSKNNVHHSTARLKTAWFLNVWSALHCWVSWAHYSLSRLFRSQELALFSFLTAFEVTGSSPSLAVLPTTLANQECPRMLMFDSKSCSNSSMGMVSKSITRDLIFMKNMTTIILLETWTRIKLMLEAILSCCSVTELI